MRDAAEVLGKHAAFTTSGREQRLESHMLSALRRSAGTSGAQCCRPWNRESGGPARARKTAFGDVRLKIERHADRIMFTCSDDGAGIDVDAVRRAAVITEFCPPPARRNCQSADALELIFCPGVTTSTSLSEVAGRGIGLEVVREVADRFKGRVSVRTEAGSRHQYRARSATVAVLDQSDFAGRGRLADLAAARGRS